MDDSINCLDINVIYELTAMPMRARHTVFDTGKEDDKAGYQLMSDVLEYSGQKKNFV